MRIIAQSQFDVNQENIEGIVLDGSSTGNKMVFSRWISDLDSASESRCLDRDIPWVRLLPSVSLSWDQYV